MMDEYIKMILALDEEFFKGWKWKEGDQFILINRKKGKIVDYQEGFIGDSVLESGNVGYIWTSGYDGDAGFEPYNSELRPVPSQEQLQALLLKNKPHKVFPFITDLHALFFNFRTFVQNDDEDTWNDFRDEFTDFNQLWLAFTMRELYQKEWNGEAWI